MTKFQAILPMALIFFIGCAQKIVVDPLARGRLTKLGHQNKERQQAQETSNLKKIIESERGERKRALQSSYTLPAEMTEENLYKDVLYSYQIRNSDRLEFFTLHLLKKYPASVFADNALYLSGHLMLASDQAGEALRLFDRLLTDYPLSNKRPAALLGKGMAFRKLGVYNYAAQMFAAVRKEYPGSAEYYKVELEEKQLMVEQSKAQ